MAYIKVDHSKFEGTADSIEAYVKLLKQKMGNCQMELLGLSIVWSGDDFTSFKNEFKKLDDKDSTHMQYINSLESYAKFLRYAAEKYKDTQAKAVNRANGLPRW